MAARATAARTCILDLLELLKVARRRRAAGFIVGGAPIPTGAAEGRGNPRGVRLGPLAREGALLAVA
jgi:hypothetical protein